MAIDFDSFVHWAEDRFGDVLVKGNEVRIHSIFQDDTKYHMWCNPYGGKKHRENGVYRCFKTDRRGTLPGLVMLVDGCTYEEAIEILAGLTSIRFLEEELDKFFAEQESIVEQEKPENKLKLPEESCLISQMSKSNFHRMEAEEYLNKRKLPIDGLMYCSHGEYKSRIVIPYYDREGVLIYFNSRHINPKAKLRYLGPPKSVGIGKSDVLYCPVWPADGEKVHLTEGEFNALTLQLCGLHSMACGGKYLSEKQLEFLKPYKICLCLDHDDGKKTKGYEHAASPGFVAMLDMAKALMAKVIPVSFVRPPKGFKDWNDMLLAHNTDIIAQYIKKCEKPIDPLTIEELTCKLIP